jgi:hypothetical protein
MLRDRYEPLNLFAYIPTLRMQMDPVLTQMDTLLDDDVPGSQSRLEQTLSPYGQ